MKPAITLPNRTGIGENEIFRFENNIVIIGGNGAGKSRLGAWIEKTIQSQITVHRISAQRALSIPEFAQLKNLEQAQKGLFFGSDTLESNVEYKNGHRWNGDPENHLLNDYNHLLSTLFARSAKRDSDYVRGARQGQIQASVPDAPIEIIERLWKEIMPQREISFGDGKVMAKKADQPEYHGKGMSDGEKVTLYLIGQCLSAADDSIIIIDEPELHLHKSLMSRLWNNIEEECPNKLLIFITHDLDFAASRKEAKKFWIKDYNGAASWIWDEVPEIEGIPENLTIEIAGNRKNVIFVEGEKSSYDAILYQAAFPTYHIIPRNGCEKVIESTKAMRGNDSLHHLRAYGIIDSDYRTPEEITALKNAGIYTIDVALVENLFCIEPLVRIVASNQMLDESTVVSEVTKYIRESLVGEFDTQISSHAEREIQFRLNAYTKQANSEAGLTQGLATLLTSIDIPLIYSNSRRVFQEAVDENSLEKMLKIYKRKSLAARVSPILQLPNGEYPKLLLRLLKSDKKAEITTAIQQLMPVLV
jgi:energy-coupling factor transporter ATP-binding protein EcfA2